METIALDRNRAVKLINKAFQCIAKDQFVEARRCLKDVLQIRKVVEKDGGSLWEKTDRQALKKHGERLFQRAIKCSEKKAYQMVIDLCDLIQDLNEVIGGFVWQNVFYVQGVAYECLGDIKGARKSFAGGAFLDPRCKRELEAIRVHMAKH